MAGTVAGRVEWPGPPHRDERKGRDRRTGTTEMGGTAAQDERNGRYCHTIELFNGTPRFREMKGANFH